jgi:hypothetical protein
MNRIPDSKRAEITAIIARVISELAGGAIEDDQAVSEILINVLEVCCRSKMQCDPDEARAKSKTALDLTTEKDWLFTVKKLGNLFELEVAFGSEMKAARLKKSMRWVLEAGTN